MAINLDGIWNSGMSMLVIGSMVTAVVLLAVCSMCGICVGCEEPRRRKPELVERMDETSAIVEVMRHAA